MNILVTGANGQLGNEMRSIAESSVHKYLFTDIDELDITDQKAVSQIVIKHGIQVIVNCAAYTNVDKAEDDERMADLINHNAVSNLARAATEVGARLIHISTDYVFGGEGNTPRTEETPTNPLGVYGATKLAGEKAIIQSGCRYVIIRTAWLYSSFGKNFVKTMRQLTADRDSLNVVFDQVGTPTYAADLALAIAEIIKPENDVPSKDGIYHFSNEGVCSWFDFAVAIAEFSGNDCLINPCHSSEFPSEVTRPAFSVLDKTKIKQTFGLNLPHWQASLKRCLQLLS